MTDLTEKWKAGELETGAYYVKDERSKVYIDEYDDEYSCGYYLRTCFSSDSVSEVLAPVPSYKELQALKAQLTEHREYCCCAKNEVLVLENANLKELLEGCKEDCGYKDLPTESVLTKIDEVLR